MNNKNSVRLKSKRFEKLVIHKKSEQRIFTLLRTIYDDRFLDMDSGDEYDADDEEYEDAEEEFASELTSEV